MQAPAVPTSVAGTQKQAPAVPVFDELGGAEQLVAQARAKGIDLAGPTGLLTQPQIVKRRQRRLTGVDEMRSCCR